MMKLLVKIVERFSAYDPNLDSWMKEQEEASVAATKETKRQQAIEQYILDRAKL